MSQSWRNIEACIYSAELGTRSRQSENARLRHQRIDPGKSAVVPPLGREDRRHCGARKSRLRAACQALGRPGLVGAAEQSVKDEQVMKDSLLDSAVSLPPALYARPLTVTHVALPFVEMALAPHQLEDGERRSNRVHAKTCSSCCGHRLDATSRYCRKSDHISHAVRHVPDWWRAPSLGPRSEAKIPVPTVLFLSGPPLPHPLWLTSLQQLTRCQSSPRSTLSTDAPTRTLPRSTTSSKTTSSKTSTAFGAKPARSTTVPRRALSRPAMCSRTPQGQLSSTSSTSAGAQRTTISTQ